MVTKVSRIHSLRTMNVCTKCHNKPSNSCWDISVGLWTNRPTLPSIKPGQIIRYILKDLIVLQKTHTPSTTLVDSNIFFTSSNTDNKLFITKIDPHGNQTFLTHPQTFNKHILIITVFQFYYDELQFYYLLYPYWMLLKTASSFSSEPLCHLSERCCKEIRCLCFYPWLQYKYGYTCYIIKDTRNMEICTYSITGQVFACFLFTLLSRHLFWWLHLVIATKLSLEQWLRESWQTRLININKSMLSCRRHKEHGHMEQPRY